MHLDDERIERLRDGELDEAAARAAREHLAACAECRHRCEDADREAREVGAALAALDGGASGAATRGRTAPVAAGTIAARALARNGARRRLVLQRAAALLVVGALAGAAWAVPGSPLPRWVGAATEWMQGDRRAAPAPAPPAIETAGIAVDPGARFVVDFGAASAGGEARVSWTDGEELALRAPRGAADFASHADRLIVDRHTAATFEIEVPRRAPYVEIRAGDRVVFIGESGRATSPAGGVAPWRIPLDGPP